MVNVSPAPLRQRRVTRVPFFSFLSLFPLSFSMGGGETKKKVRELGQFDTRKRKESILLLLFLFQAREETLFCSSTFKMQEKETPVTLPPSPFWIGAGCCDICKSPVVNLFAAAASQWR